MSYVERPNGEVLQVVEREHHHHHAQPNPLRWLWWLLGLLLLSLLLWGLTRGCAPTEIEADPVDNAAANLAYAQGEWAGVFGLNTPDMYAADVQPVTLHVTGNTANFSFGCNTISAQLDADNMITNVGSTDMACPMEISIWESLFVEMLSHSPVLSTYDGQIAFTTQEWLADEPFRAEFYRS